ncbi:GNAT family N-acetyltransferase [Arthrobacter livingstonensis]|uniref:GNAT family N-acetyltransferase n=1 Tax=Arthrobacter livingstonensis TaxID=670078 RepID=A0A2V5LY02_9MICC|nr:GNAT family N-acetyltransferase [Arthrobacter livingstonensis]PYI67286.1 GNAT family N-acetyltransferase [Arthrobacter livingstonensis]
MGIIIRQANTADAPALAELAAVTFPLACPPGSTPEDIAAFTAAKLSVNAFASYLNNPAMALFVAEVPAGEADGAGGAFPQGGTRLLAYTLLVDVPPSDADVAAVVGETAAVELSKCYARPDCHGGGTTARIMAASLDWAEARGARQVWLGVNSANMRARRFYEKHGFTVAGNKNFQLGKRVEHDFVMVRPA